MAIIGKAARASENIIARVAEKVGCEPAVIDAIITVETGADPFDPSGRLVIRPEAHKVVKCPYLDAEAKKKAAKLGFTKQPKLPGYHIDPVAAGNAAWAWVDKFSREFGEDAACWITSFGAPQIMGFNHNLCKFGSPSAMVRAFADEEDEQYLAMGEFLIGSGLKDACKQRKWATIARLYNGPDYAKNRYDTKLADAYARSEQKKGSAILYPNDDVLEMGEKGEKIRALQKRLSELGFPLKADGDFGAETRDAVRAVQYRLGLAVDGRVGPLTQKALASAAPKDPPSTPVHEVVLGSNTAKASVAQIVTGVVATAVAGASASVPQAPVAPVPTLSDVDAALKTAEQGIGLSQKILAIGVDKLLIALGIGAIIFGGIALYRRIDAHYQRKIG